MKPKYCVTSFRGKCREAHFTVPSSVRSMLLSMPLSSELYQMYHARSVLIRKDDKVQVVCCTYKGCEGKVLQVYRRHWVIHIEWITKEKVNGSIVPISIHPSKVIVTKMGTTTACKP